MTFNDGAAGTTQSLDMTNYFEHSFAEVYNGYCNPINYSIDTATYLSMTTEGILTFAPTSSSVPNTYTHTIKAYLAIDSDVFLEQ